MGRSNQNPTVGNENKFSLVLTVVGFLAIGLLISTVFLGIKLNEKSDELKNQKKNEIASFVCNTEECAKASGDMIKAMDRSVDPCKDFYKFSCGNWIKNNPTPDSASSWNQFNILRDHLNRKIRTIVEAEIKDDEPTSVKHGKLFYKSCLNHNVTDQVVLQELIETTLKINEYTSNIGRKIGELRRRTTGNFFVTLFVELDERNTSNHIIYLDQPTLGLNRAYLTATDHVNKKAYSELIASSWPLVYPNDTIEDPVKLSEKIVAFETKIAKLSTAPEERRNRTELYHLLNLAQLGDHTANATAIDWDWEDYIAEVFKDVVQDHNVNLGHFPSLTVVVRDLKYFKEFANLLSTSYMADPTILVNYLRWRIILTYGNDISSKLRNVFFEYTKKAHGTHYPAPRWQVCSDRANAAFGMAISYHYVQEVFSGNFSSQMSEMIENIQEVFTGMIDEAKWIRSDETRSKAKQKALKMMSFIGFPEWLLNNDTALEAYYQGLELNTTMNYFDSFLQISKWKNSHNLKSIIDSKDRNKWITDPTVVNAFYSTTYNSITFPAGILQPPFYFTGKPIQALNYGAIGMIISHEVCHGFDDRGRQSDGNGNLLDWWDKATVNQYVEKANCFTHQYSKYQVAENLTINGNNTLGENIADNGGLRQAFKAYQAYIEKHGPEPKLPGLEYSPEQLFFIAFSQIWCGTYSSKGMEAQIRTGAHSPNSFRVKGALQNSIEFAKTWKCKKPENICKLW